MDDLWLILGSMAVVFALDLALGAAVKRALLPSPNRAARLVDEIRARGTMTIVQTEDGEPCCPHCGHTLRSAS